jgi:hypothetical protein
MTSPYGGFIQTVPVRVGREVPRALRGRVERADVEVEAELGVDDVVEVLRRSPLVGGRRVVDVHLAVALLLNHLADLGGRRLVPVALDGLGPSFA